MELLFSLTDDQMEKVYEEQERIKFKADVQTVLDTRFENVELTEEEMETATGYAICIQKDTTHYLDIAQDAIQMVLDERPEEFRPPDLLNDTLKSIGLKTMQYFKIADKEFETDDFYIDSFGDVYWVNGHPDDPDRETACDEQHEFLTLGRILTQYYDKVVPFEE